MGENLNRLAIALCSTLILGACVPKMNQTDSTPPPITPSSPRDTDNQARSMESIDLYGLPGQARVDVVHRKAHRKGNRYGQAQETFRISVYQYNTFQFSLDIRFGENGTQVNKTGRPVTNNNPYRAEAKVYDTKFQTMSEYLRTLHRFETARCRTSQFWSYIKDHGPNNRGDFLISLGSSLYSQAYNKEALIRISPNGKVVDVTIVRDLEIGRRGLALKYVALADVRQIEYGTPGQAVRDFSNFSDNCSNAYRRVYGGANFQNKWLPLYSTPEVDRTASIILDQHIRGKSGYRMFSLGLRGYETYDVQGIENWRRQFPTAYNPAIQTPEFR